MTITYPLALLLLLLILPLQVLFVRQRLARLSPRRGTLALALRLLVTTLIVSALSDPQREVAVSRQNIMFVGDVSPSLGAQGQQTIRRWISSAAAHASPSDRIGALLFAQSPHLSVPLAHYANLPTIPAAQSGAATDIGAALRLGLAVLPSTSPSRLVLLSDGRATTGDTSSAVALALTRNVPVDTVAIPPTQQHDASIQSVVLPPTTHVGDSLPIRIALHSTHTTNAILRVWLDETELQQTISLPAGDTLLRSEHRISTLGIHTVRAQIQAPGDEIPQNNALDAVTMAGPRGHLLFALTNPAAATNLATTLTREGLSVTPILAQDLPNMSNDYHGYDEIILYDVPATSLHSDQQAALRDAVHDDGLGLVTIGGRHAYGNGQYGHTLVGDALPVDSTSIPREPKGPLSVVLLIDKSGSMSNAVAGVSKVDMIKVAASSALDRLHDGDSIGVLAFDNMTRVIVPFHTLKGPGDKDLIRQQIAGIKAEGDTAIYPALQMAEQTIQQVPASNKHIILLTDGQGEGQVPFTTLIKHMHNEHITLSTIGVGTDVVQDELRLWARLGDGRFHYVSDPHDIPRIVVNETRFGAQNGTEVHGTSISLGIADPSPLLRSLAGRPLPPVSAYDSTLLKNKAQLIIRTATGDPLLASWQYGLGRVVSWTSEEGVTWAPAWSATSTPPFWSNLAYWALHAYTPSPRLPQLTLNDGTLHLSVAGPLNSAIAPHILVTTPSHKTHIISLALAAPGDYGADLSASQPGVYTAALLNGTPNTSTDLSAVAIPYSSEYRNNGVDTATLSQIASETGGRVLRNPTDTFHAPSPITPQRQPLWPFLLTGALLLYLLDIAVRLLVPQAAVYRTRQTP